MGRITNTTVAQKLVRLKRGRKRSVLKSRRTRFVSGMRSVAAGGTAAGLAVSEKLREQIGVPAPDGRSTDEDISSVVSAKVSLNELSSDLARMRE